MAAALAACSNCHPLGAAYVSLEVSRPLPEPGTAGSSSVAVHRGVRAVTPDGKGAAPEPFGS
ncbi:hypothetical protein ACFQ7Z_38195, partial [Streptomyces virginiae]|uniref:hypothetical protein n=1 Tax=Streptomyces virginiae TaxID=1961 RepID=UPI0036B1BA21